MRGGVARGDGHQGCTDDRFHGFELVERNALAQTQWQSDAPQHLRSTPSRFPQGRHSRHVDVRGHQERSVATRKMAYQSSREIKS